jgi:site-specific recombinase XerC
MRLEGIASLRCSAGDPEASDVDLRSRVVRISAKGRRELVLPIGTKAARDIDRHIRVRAGHPRGRRVAVTRHEGPAHGERRLSDDQRPRGRNRAS